MAEGGAITAPHEDPHVLAAVHAAVHAAAGGPAGVTAIQIGPSTEAALTVRLRLAEDADEQAVLRTAATRLSEHLRGLVFGGVQISVISG
jgi:hypothetical protein